MSEFEIRKLEREVEKFGREIEHEAKVHPVFTKAMIFLAFAIPILILLYVVYINYLPFGYSRSYELTIDENGIISPLSDEVYIEDSNGRRLLSLPEGVQGQVNVIIDPGVVLKDATIDIEIQGDDGVFLATPLETNLDELEWDYAWDFTQSVPSDLEGTAEYSEEEQCVYFGAYQEQTLYLPNSHDMFESEPMSIYVRWKPLNNLFLDGSQQIVGHYNWKIYHGENKVRFQVGKMNDENGSFYNVNYPITSGFFNEEHEILAIYSPDIINGKGYIELYVDNQFAQRVLIESDIIYQDYNADRPLNFGWSPHNFQTNPYFDGCIYEAKIVNEIISETRKSGKISEKDSMFSVPIIGEGSLKSVNIEIVK